MSKELEKEFMNDIMDSGELQVEPTDIAKLLYDIYDVPSGICAQVKDMAQRLESIDNTNLGAALSRIEDCLYEDPYADRNDVSYENDIATIKQALLELKTIKESDPSEALECVDVLKEDGCITTLYQGKALETIRQALLGAQETKKKYAYIEKLETMMKQKECVLRYVESEDCFAIKTMLSSWYKLTPEFIDNNVREEITPLPLIKKNRQLREENAEYEEVLKLVFDRKVDIYHLSKSKTVEDYNSIWDSSTYCLTEEEFDLLKRWQNGKRI